MVQTSMGSSSCISLKWTHEEDRIIEQAVTHMNNKSITFLDELAMRLPGKTTTQVVRRYLTKGGLFDCSGDNVCLTPPLPKGEEEDVVVVSENPNNIRLGRLYSNPRVWSLEEHKMFLIGVSMYGMGEWDVISKNCVKTRTSAQVASHAKKFFENLEKPITKSSRGPRSVFDIHTVEECDKLISEREKNNLGQSLVEIPAQNSTEATTMSLQVIPPQPMLKRKHPIVTPSDSEKVALSHRSQQPLSIPLGQEASMDINTPPLPPGFENKPVARDSSSWRASKTNNQSNVFANLLAQSSLRAAFSEDVIHPGKIHRRRNTKLYAKKGQKK